MVFEAVVVDVLNRFLGSYVENLNKDQLKLGIWGGDVVLQNLTVKQTALEELNFPVKTVFGHLGKLVLKIPWKNLYGASVEATIDNLLLIVHPIAEVKYNAEKEEKQALADKQAELRRIEDARKREADKDKPKIDETFVEKLATQIIKNVQLKIARIHVRYEDTITNPAAPFSCGFTLHNLSVHTTDSNWTQAVATEAVTKIYKILNLEGLSIYWNPNANIYSKKDPNAILETLSNRIATKTTKGLHYNYLLGPINATAKLQLNPKPESDDPPFKVAKVVLTLHMEELAVSLNRNQYQDIMRLADSFDMMTKAAPYRKYRPDLKVYRGHYKTWWHFAYKCILIEDVRRRRNNWDWNHMKAYRDLCRSYGNAYMQYKLANKGKVATEIKDLLEKGEKELAILSLVIMRQQMDTEVEKIKQEEKAAMQQKGWFSRWWSGGGVEVSDSDLNLIKRFEAEITPEEKAKLYRAIDYQETSSPQDLPKTYVSVDARFTLDTLKLVVTDKVTVMRGAVNEVQIDFAQRPSANAMRVDVSMQKFSVFGVEQGGYEPQLVASKEVSENVKLINISFETNPIDGKCDSRVIVSARPLEIIYDAQTIIEIVNVFKPPQDTTALSTLQEAAALKLLDLKEKSATGMQYMVDQHSLIELDINMDSSYIVVPYTGLYKGKEACCVIQLGTLSVKSEPRSATNVNEMYLQGFDEERIFNEVSNQCYDKLAISLDAIQVVLSYPEEDWHSSLSCKEATDLHLLEPTNLVIRVHKCVIEDDPRMPKLKIFGDLENVYISAAEDRLYKLFEILIDMPLPQADQPEPLVKISPSKTVPLFKPFVPLVSHLPSNKSAKSAKSNPSPSRASSMSLLKYLDSTSVQKNVHSESLSETTLTQLTNVEALFVMKELKITMKRKVERVYDKYLVFILNLLEVKATQKTYTLTSEVKLGAISFNQYRQDYSVVNVIDTPLWRSGSGDQYLFNIRYYNVDRKCPEFRSFYQSVEQLIELEFSNVKLLLHLECLQQILVIANEYQTRLNEMQMQRDRIGDAGPLETIREDEELVATKSKATVVEKKSKRHKVETIHLKVMINIKNIGIGFSTDHAQLTDVQLKNMAAGLIVKDSYTQMDCLIGDIKIIDLYPTTIHKEILSVVKGEVANIRCVLYNQQFSKTPDNVDMSVNVEFSCLRLVFINRFVTSMLGFLNNFQEAQNRIIQASSQAADAARANVQSAYANSTKIDMNLKLDAPIIVVPENSISLRALLFDFGQMNIDNKFVDLPIENESAKVTTDELTLDLEDMKLTYINMDEDGQLTLEKTILQPISCSLLVKRNLSMWYDRIPDLEVSGRLKSIILTLTRDDYQSIMNILTQNLQEGVQEAPKKPKHPMLTEKATHESVNAKPKVSVTKSTVSLSSLAKTQESVKTSIKFQFTMDSFVIDLYHMVNEKMVSLAQFRLVLLCMRGRMLSNGSIHTSILLIDMTLDDMRPGREDKITRYLERRRSGRGDGEETIASNSETTPKEIRSMVDITFTSKNNDTFIDMRVFSFNLILAMDFMNKLLAFLAVDKEDKEKFTGHDIKEEAAKKRSATVANVKSAATAVSVVSAHEKPQEEDNAMMTVNIRIEKPDIILVESLDSKDCMAMVLNMECEMKYRHRDQSTVADGGISELQLYIRKFSDPPPTEVSREPRYVLSPTSISVAMSQPPNSGMHVDMALSDINITISPDVLELVNKVIKTVTSSGEEKQQTEDVPIKYENVWGAEPFDPNSFWFLKTELGEEASELTEMNYEQTGLKKVSVKAMNEICMLSSPSIVFSLELEIGSERLPMLVMQASLSATVKDWSSSLLLESTWAMQLSYYNIQRAMWEPFIEPVEILENSTYKHSPWELHIHVAMRGEEKMPSIVDISDEEAAAKAMAEKKAKMSVLFTSDAHLDLTISRSGLEALTELGAAFSAVTAVDGTINASTQEIKRNKYEGAPFVFHNYTGLNAKLVFDDRSDFCVHSTKKSVNDYREVVLETNSHVPLQLRRPGANIVKLNEPSPPRRLDVKIEGLGEIQIPVERADKRYFPLAKKTNSESWGLVSEVAMLDASLNVSLRSIVQVTNNLSVSVSAYYMKPSGNEVSLLGEVKPGNVLRLPVQAVYTPSAELFFSVDGFTVSVSPFSWRQLQQELQVTKLLHCNTKEKGSIEKFYLWVVGDMEQAFFESSNRHTFASSCYNIKLEPAVILQNCLPVDVVVSESGLRRSKPFNAGELAHMSHLAPNRATIVILIPNYLEKSWECTAQIPASETEFSVWSFTSHDSPDVMTLDLGMHNKNSNGTQHLSIYCPFWMLNKTGLTLSYRRKKADKRGTPKKNLDDADVIFHPADYKEPVLFSFRAKNFFGKKKASIRVEFGEWSDKFSLDIAGSSGVIYCKNEGRTYQVAVTNTLSFNSLTKMVVFMPFVILTNYAPFDVEYQEAQRPGDPWKTVEKKSCASVWPISEKAQKLFIFRVRGTHETSAPMVITEEHATCLKLANEYGGLNLEVQMCEGGTNITVRQYVEGHAPALLINYSPETIKVYEKDNVNVRKLQSMHKMMFTWDHPAGPRVLIMRGLRDAVCAKKEVEIDLKQDGIGTMQVEEHTYVSWVSFLNGIQRVILITDDIMLARGVYVAGENEIMDIEVILSMKGMGLSLVNDVDMQEIVYCSACHSGIIWEQCKIGAQRYKKLDPLKITEFELAYQRYLMEKQIHPESTSPLVNIDERTLVNWAEMRILKPNGRLLRRTLEPGLWACYSSAAHSTQIHARLHRLQIDQQLPSATFPVTLAPTPPPLSLQNQGIKPFIEVSIVEHIMKNSSVRQYKYFKILVQEFHIKIDMGLVNALMNMFPQKELTQQEALEAFTKDLESAKSKIDDLSIVGTATEQSNFYDNLHLSPLKVHVSFSLGNSTTIPTFVGTLLQGIGVTLTDMNDVVFKLSYYERRYQFLTQTELQTQIQKHYTGQALKQLYVLVLGLDVLGNPYGLVVGLKKGVEDLFYEPFQGAIQGPGEFAEGLYIGVRSLVGHTVGGAAGAFSRITGAMGHGIAALSMDKDYQKQRRDGMNKPPTSLQEGLARSGRGLVMGFVDGVTGVITKPLEGAQEEGVEGFFKGLGRGAVGLVARPTAGLVDFASGSLGAVRRAADLSEEITRRRPPRYLPKNQGVTPYSRQQAEGSIILSEIEKGKYQATDTYEAHVWVIVSKEAVLCTDKRIIYVEKNNVFGGLQVAWTFLWTELTEAPSSVAKGVFIPTGKKKVFGMFNSSNVGKVILISNEDHKQYLLSQCVRLHRMSVH